MNLRKNMAENTLIFHYQSSNLFCQVNIYFFLSKKNPRAKDGAVRQQRRGKKFE
jgi:hypothetical protein